jgi:aryl-alcohol dehydrogenase-like predicted oxidoreductase
VRYRQLGISGLTVSVLGLGCNNFGLTCTAEQSRTLVDAALDAGITLFDTAQAYGNPRGTSEAFLGDALKHRRHRAVLSTKVGSFSLRTPDVAPASRRGIRAALEASLHRLQTDYVDLLYLHQPDDLTPIEETLAAMTDLIHEGKVRYIGSANLSAWRVVEAELVAQRHGYERFIVAQNAYSLVDRMVELDLAVVCSKYGIGMAPYFPLANGLLTGRYRRGEPPPPGSRLAVRQQVLEDESALDGLEALQSFAAERGVSLLQVALGGLAAKPAVGSVIAGASRPEHVYANAAACDWQPTTVDMATLDTIAPPLRYIPLGSRTGHRRIG